jgi:hypothetical protein
MTPLVTPLTFLAMSAREYVEQLFPDKDYDQMTIWEIGSLDYSLIFSQVDRVMPAIYKDNIMFDLHPWLPQRYFNYWRSSAEIFWSCRYCGFWCDIFDQRIMESHLLTRCGKVC